MSKESNFLEAHGWVQIHGLKKGKYGSQTYWRDPNPKSLEPMRPMGQAVTVQRIRNRQTVPLRPICLHQRCDENGICRNCGADRRGI